MAPLDRPTDQGGEEDAEEAEEEEEESAAAAAAAAALRPIQSCADATDLPCLYMADPFLVHGGGDTWYLFTEVIDSACQKGEIALSVSRDGLASFQYAQVVQGPRPPHAVVGERDRDRKTDR